jgi:hypothetical protein
VVRQFHTEQVPATASGRWLAAASKKRSFVIAYVSDATTLEVLGADALSVP